MTQSISDYRSMIERQLQTRLSKLLRLKEQGVLKMTNNNANLAITKSNSFYTDSMTIASYQTVGADPSAAFVVYVTSTEARFGLYDEDKEASLPVDLHELVNTWIDEPPAFQRNMLSLIRDDINVIIEQSV